MFSIIFPLIVLLLLSLFARKAQKSWFCPAAFFPLVWLIFLTTGIVFAPDFNPNSLGVWSIVLFSSSVVMGALVVPINVVSQNTDQILQWSKSNISVRSIYNTCIALTCISGVGILVVIFFGFARFQLEEDLMSLFILPNLFAVDRYDEVLYLPIPIKAIMFLTYPAALIGGFASNFYSGIKKHICYWPIIITTLYGAIFAWRAGILLGIILTFSGLLCAKILSGTALNKWFKKVSIIGIGTAFALMILYIFISWIRRGFGQELIFSELFIIAKAGILGSYSAYTHWFQSSYIPGHDLGFGTNTFAGPMEVFGLSIRQQGFYKDFTQIGSSYTNIYTVFRGLILDYGVIGAVIFCIGMGFFSSMAFKATYEGKILWVVPLSAFYAFVLFSPLLSIFSFNSIVVSFIIFACVLILSLGDLNEKNSYHYR